MNRNKKLLLYKEVDRSLFNEGIILPQELNHIFGQTNDWEILEEGKFKTVRIFLDGSVYYADVLSISGVNKEKEDKNLILTYPKNSDLSNKFKTLFKYTYESYLPKREKRKKDDLTNKFTNIKKEYVSIYSTKYLDTYYMKTISINDTNDCILSEDDKTHKNIGYAADIIRILHIINYNKYKRENWQSYILKFHKSFKERQSNILLNKDGKHIWGRKVELDQDERIEDVLGWPINNKEFIREIEEEDLIGLIYSDNFDFIDFKRIANILFTRKNRTKGKETIEDRAIDLDVIDNRSMQDKSDRIIENIIKELNAFEEITNHYNDMVAGLINKANIKDDEINKLKETIKELNEKNEAEKELRSIREELIEIKSLLKNEKIF